MRGFADVFMLELRMRRVVFPAALIAGLIPIPMASIMADVAGFSEALNVGADAFALIAGELLALYLGATVLCQDLSEGRQGFFFARPISGFALWAGKFSAVWAVVLGAMLVVLLPATLMGEGLAKLGAYDNPLWVNDLGPQTLSPLWGPAFAALAILLLLGLAHAVSLMFRSHSTWLVLDAVMVVLIPSLAWVGLRRMTGWEFHEVFMIISITIGVILLLALLVAGALQTTFGRCDLRRGHKVLSLTLWGITTLAVSVITAYIFWATSVSPSRLRAISTIRSAPQGSWISLGGPGPGLGAYAEPTFLLDTRTGAWVRTSMSRWSIVPTFSPDGKTALVYTRSMGVTDPGEVVSFDLTASGRPRVQHHGISFSIWSPDFSFSPDASRLAIFHGKDLEVYDLPSWNLLAARKFDPDAAGSTVFMSRDLLRIYRFSRELARGGALTSHLTILEWDLAKKTLETTGTTENVVNWSIRTNADRTRLIMVQHDGREFRTILCDGRTGEVLNSLGKSSNTRRNGAFLEDGRVVTFEKKGEDRILHVFSSSGAEESATPWSPGKDHHIWIGPEPLPGKVLIGSWNHRTDKSTTNEIFLWDVTTGDVRLLPGLHTMWDGAWSPLARGTVSSVKAEAGLFLDDAGKVVRYDFATGKTEAVKIGS